MASNCSEDLPDSLEYLRDVAIVYLVLFGITGALTLVTLVMYIETVVFFFMNLYNWKPKDKAKWVLAIYPVITLTSFISLVVPRSSNVNSLVATCYFSVCIYQFVTMLIGHYGGARRMSSRLQESNIKLSTPPFCCCCACLPSPKVTSHNIHVVQTLVIQYAIAGPLLSYCGAIMWANNAYYPNAFKNPSTYFNMISTISSMVALWGMDIVFRMAEPMLSHAHIKPKFYCVQIINSFTGLQSLIINILVMTGVIKCDGMLNAVAVAKRYNNICLIFEMFGVWLVARHFYRRDIQDIPIDDQVYVQTTTMATAMTGTLSRDLDPNTSQENPYVPTCARDIMKGSVMKRSVGTSGIRLSAPVDVFLDTEFLDYETKHQLKNVLNKTDSQKRQNVDKRHSDPYEPVQRNGQKCEMGVGPDHPYEPTELKPKVGRYSSPTRSTGTVDQTVHMHDVNLEVDLPDGIKSMPATDYSLSPATGDGHATPLSTSLHSLTGGQSDGMTAPIQKPPRTSARKQGPDREKSSNASSSSLDIAHNKDRDSVA